MSGISKLRFKGDKPKKKKRSHRESHGGDDLEALAKSDPTGWIFPEADNEISGPAYILLPTKPLTCLAWDPTRQRVYAAPVDIPEVAEGASELSPNELLMATEPTDINHVWVASRLAGSEELNLRSSAGTFLTATPSGQISATTPSRGPLEGFRLKMTEGSLFPTVTVKTSSDKYISIPRASEETILSRKAELRADAEDADEREDVQVRVKCQREFVVKARIEAMDSMEGSSGKRRLLDRGPAVGSYEDELKKNTQMQAWGSGRHHVSKEDRKALKKATKEVGLAEAMLDRRAKMKSDKWAR